MPQAKQRGEYPANWDRIAAWVKTSAGGCCVRCGHKHDPAAGRTLTVHHFDGDRGNNELWNLMALCQACHLSVQSRVDPSQGLLGDPAPWCMPYVAGMVEAGKTPAPPRYGDAWLWIYRSATGSEWPRWAPPPGYSKRLGRIDVEGIFRLLFGERYDELRQAFEAKMRGPR